MSCIRTFNLLHQWRIPSQFRSHRLPKGAVRLLELQTAASRCLCCGLQTSAAGEAIDNDSGLGSCTQRAREIPLRKYESIGAFQKLPMVMPSVDILSSAQRKARNVSPTKGIVNIAKRERNKGAKQLDALMKELAIPLREYLENFPKKRYLHPYERSLIELTFGEGNYEKVLGRVDALRKKLIINGKQHASLCAQSSSKREAEERLNEGLNKLEEVFQLEKNSIEDLIYVAKKLRAMPVVDPKTPTLCLVGAPNVGKSSLVRILSSGKPEICNYPFTTRGVLMGHIVLNYERFQVTDTPGLLTRHDEDRNNLERLTLAVLSHLPTAVLYVHDLYGECGTSTKDQFITYKEIKERFSDRLWIDVVSKCDLSQASPSGFLGAEDEEERYKLFGPHGAIHVSVTDGIGIAELKSRVDNLLITQMAKIKSDESKLEN